MKIQYFSDTDTLYIEFQEGPASSTGEIAESVYVDYDDKGQVMALTVDAVSSRTDMQVLDLVNVPQVHVRSLVVGIGDTPAAVAS